MVTMMVVVTLTASNFPITLDIEIVTALTI
jgi:hypothetical protein